MSDDKDLSDAARKRAQKREELRRERQRVGSRRQPILIDNNPIPLIPIPRALLPNLTQPPFPFHTPSSPQPPVSPATSSILVIHPIILDSNSSFDPNSIFNTYSTHIQLSAHNPFSIPTPSTARSSHQPTPRFPSSWPTNRQAKERRDISGNKRPTEKMRRAVTGTVKVIRNEKYPGELEYKKYVKHSTKQDSMIIAMNMRIMDAKGEIDVSGETFRVNNEWEYEDGGFGVESEEEVETREMEDVDVEWDEPGYGGGYEDEEDDDVGGGGIVGEEVMVY